MDLKYKESDTTSRNGQSVHTEDIQDIISTPPHALLRWGIAWILAVLLGAVALAAFVRYPDIVHTSVRINAANAPKAVISKASGNIINILVQEGDTVDIGQPLAWMESTANHRHVLELLEQLYTIRNLQSENGNLSMVHVPANLHLGELQHGYQAFYQSYLNYQATIGDGIYLRRRGYIQFEMSNIQQQRTQLERQLELQQREYALAETEFGRYRELAERKVISPAEFQQQQAAFFAKQHPLQQTQTSMLVNDASLTAKAKELADLENQIVEEKSRFMQALNSLTSEAEQWKNQYIITAPQTGRVVYAGIIQPNQHITAGQEVFHVNPGSTDFFGELNVPQYNMGKVKPGQEVLIKLDGYPFQEYGIVKGEISQLNSLPVRDSLFLARTTLDLHTIRQGIQLRTGMVGSAEIVTEDASLLQRLMRNIRLVLDRATALN